VGPRAGLEAVKKRKILSLPGIEWKYTIAMLLNYNLHKNSGGV
jgi:hypothetical protein